MRLIDADALEYQMLYKENWLKGTGYEAQAIWKEDVDSQPTIDAVAGGAGMRLIDADKLKQHYSWWNNEEQRTFDQIVDAQPTVGGECIPREWLLKNTNTGMNVIEMMQAIKDAPVIAFPPIDAAPVVRCRECEGWVATENSDLGLCVLTKRVVTRRDYCSEGKRKDGADHA